MHTRDYRLLSYFASIVEHGSLSAAARALNVSAPVVSKALGDLEQRLATTLLVRGAGRAEPTPSGERVYAHAREMSRSAERAMGTLAPPGEDVKGSVAITLPSELAHGWLPDVMAGFGDAHPHVAITVFAQDHNQDLDRSRCDLALRAVRATGGERQAHALLSTPLVLVRAPGTDGAVARLETELGRVPFVGFTFREDNECLVAVSRRSGRSRRFALAPHHHVDSGQLGKELALRGKGLALVMASSVRTELAEGRLVRIGQDHDFGTVDIVALMRDRYPSAAAAAFRRYLTETANEG